MTDRLYDTTSISRRKILAGLGTIGVASVGAGLGTSAYFSDSETYTGNQLVAGSLDLKVDWEEHYSDWSSDEAASVSDIVMVDDQTTVPEGYVGLPDPQNPMIAIPAEEVGSFMDATSIEAYPDVDDDGVQEQDVAGNPVFPDDAQGNPQTICDVDADLDAALDSDLRTEEYRGESVVNLQDVKPGDFGELTLSFHLCDNPGYVWLQGANFAASENGYTEPELSDVNESGNPGDDPAQDSTVELLDKLEAVLWYDQDGDNVLDARSGSGEVCVQLVLDSSGSMTSTDGDGISRQDEMKNGAKQLAAAILNANANSTIGVTEFDDDANLLLSVASAGASDLTTIEAQIDSVDASGGTAIDTGINTANSDLGNCPADVDALMIVVTDGENNDGTGPVQTASDNAIASNTDEIYAVGTAAATQATLAAIANPDDDAHIELTTDLNSAIANLTAAVLGSEEVIFRGTFADLFAAMEAQNGGSNAVGIPLDGNRATDYDELNDPADDPNRECFSPIDTHHLGFAWYLPVNHSNEIQTDSVSFDFGFYTEQCRHNNGRGMAAEQEAAATTN